MADKASPGNFAAFWVMRQVARPISRIVPTVLVLLRMETLPACAHRSLPLPSFSFFSLPSPFSLLSFTAHGGHCAGAPVHGDPACAGPPSLGHRCPFRSYHHPRGERKTQACPCASALEPHFASLPGSSVSLSGGVSCCACKRKHALRFWDVLSVW